MELNFSTAYYIGVFFNCSPLLCGSNYSYRTKAESVESCLIPHIPSMKMFDNCSTWPRNCPKATLLDTLSLVSLCELLSENQKQIMNLPWLRTRTQSSCPSALRNLLRCGKNIILLTFFLSTDGQSVIFLNWIFSTSRLPF